MNIIATLRGSPYPELSKNRFFFFFQSMDLLSENIVAKFYSPYRNSFDGRVPSSGLRRASGRFFSPSENFKTHFLKTTFFKIACTIKGEPIKGLYQCDTFKKLIFFLAYSTVCTFKNILGKFQSRICNIF